MNTPLAIQPKATGRRKFKEEESARLIRFPVGWDALGDPRCLAESREAPANVLMVQEKTPALSRFCILSTLPAHVGLARQRARWGPAKSPLCSGTSHSGAHETNPKLLLSGSPKDGE